MRRKQTSVGLEMIMWRFIKLSNHQDQSIVFQSLRSQAENKNKQYVYIILETQNASRCFNFLIYFDYISSMFFFYWFSFTRACRRLAVIISTWGGKTAVIPQETKNRVAFHHKPKRYGYGDQYRGKEYFSVTSTPSHLCTLHHLRRCNFAK